MKRYTARRLIAVFLGNILIGIGVAIFRMTLLGNDPSTAFVLSVAAKAGMELAPMLWICGAAWFVLELIWGRKFIGLGTFVNWFLLGVVADGVTWVLNHFFTVPEAFLPRFLIMLLTLPVVSLGVSLYQSSELGASPYDSLALILMTVFPKFPISGAASRWTARPRCWRSCWAASWAGERWPAPFALGPSSTSLTNIFPSLSAKCRKMSRSPSKTRKKAEKTLDNRGKIRIIIVDSLETYAEDSG